MEKSKPNIPAYLIAQDSFYVGNMKGVGRIYQQTVIDTYTNRQENDLFFVCSLIEAIGRKTKNHRRVVVNALGIAEIRHLLELADVYHSENMEKLIDNLTEKYLIPQGTFDNVSACRYAVPSIFDIGKVYKRLIVAVSKTKRIDFPDTLIEVYNSWIADRLDDYNSSMFFENPEYIYQSYLIGKPLDA